MEELKQWLVEEKSNHNVIDGMTELIKLNNEVKDASYSVESSAIELSDAILKLDRVFNPEKSKEDTYYQVIYRSIEVICSKFCKWDD